MISTRIGVVLWALAPLLLWLSLTRPYGENHGRAAALPTTLGPFERTSELELTARHRELLGTDDACWRVYREPSGARDVYVVAVFHGSNWKSVHPPHICLRGSDMAITEDGAVTQSVDGRDVRVGRIVTRANRGGHAYLSRYAFVANGLVTDSYGDFAMHHLPRVLLRRGTAGCLVRVETWIDPRDPAAAERRVAELLARLLVAIEASLR